MVAKTAAFISLFFGAFVILMTFGNDTMTVGAWLRLLLGFGMVIFGIIYFFVGTDDE
jgi:hypothetical protein